MRETDGERERQTDTERDKERQTKTETEEQRGTGRGRQTRCEGKADPGRRVLGPEGGGEGGPRPGRGAESQAGKTRIHSRGDTGRGVWMWAAGATS